MSLKPHEEIKESIDKVPHSPVSAMDPMLLSQDVCDVNPGGDLSSTQVNIMPFMTAPNTQ